MIYTGWGNWLTCISVESQMFLRLGNHLRMLPANSMYSSKPTTTISQALSPILTCMLRRGRGIYGLWSDHTRRSISDLVLVVPTCNCETFWISFKKIYWYWCWCYHIWTNHGAPWVHETSFQIFKPLVSHPEYSEEPTLLLANQMQSA